MKCSFVSIVRSIFSRAEQKKLITHLLYGSCIKYDDASQSIERECSFLKDQDQIFDATVKFFPQPQASLRRLNTTTKYHVTDVKYHLIQANILKKNILYLYILFDLLRGRVLMFWHINENIHTGVIAPRSSMYTALINLHRGHSNSVSLISPSISDCLMCNCSNEHNVSPRYIINNVKRDTCHASNTICHANFN